MANSKHYPQEFIRDAFTPQIGVLCSPGAEGLCQKNNLTFIELLQPFCRLSSELHYKDPNGGSVTLKQLKISLVDVHAKPPHTTIARKCLNSSVSEAPVSASTKYVFGDYSLETPMSAPWFEAWRETFFQVQYPADHEFTKHLLGCILVVSTSEDNAVEAMEKLVGELAQLQNGKLPKWFGGSALNYFIVLHENFNGDDIKAQETFDRMKVAYGAMNCFLLRTNSRPLSAHALDPNQPQLPDPWSKFINRSLSLLCPSSTLLEHSSPEHSPIISARPTLEMAQEANEAPAILVYHPLSPDMEDTTLLNTSAHETIEAPPAVLHGGCLSTDDVEQIKLVVKEFASRGLLPHIERQIHVLSDFVANKKGVSKSLFSATKRWFTPNKPTSNSATINTLTYPADAPELQIRRLGDLYFMFGHYSMAYQAYHTAKRDFMADQAWLYCAGALEMASLAAFMANEPTRKTFDYMEESINTFLNTCKMPQFATMATLLSAECLRGQSMFGEAAHQLIRMANEDSDLRSALLLEQAAYCFLQCGRPTMVRKYAFHMVLAGHRFTKASQRRHALRCYEQAHQVYRYRGWNLAADHILSSIGRLARNLDQLDQAMQAYGKLLTDESRQTASQQEIYLKEYLGIHSELQKRQNNLLTPILPLPLVLNESIKLLVGPTPPLRTPGRVPAVGISLTLCDSAESLKKWNKLEEMLVQEAQGSLPMIFKPMTTLFTSANFDSTPIAIVGEPIQVAVELYNPLQILINLKDIYLLWTTSSEDNRFAVNEIMGTNVDHVVKTHYVKSLVIQANERQEVVLSVTPLVTGVVCVLGICYSLNSEGEICLRGKQLFSIGAKSKGKASTKVRIEVTVVPSAPSLQVNFGEMNAELLRNELQEVTVELRNMGSLPLHNIHMATSTPQLLSCQFNKPDPMVEPETISRDKEARKNHVSHLPLPSNVLAPGQYHTCQIWLKAPEHVGPAAIDLLIYYENVDATAVPRYRLVRHIWSLSIQESIKVEATPMPSCASRDVEQMALMVRATNLNKVHHAILTEIKLLTAALLSNNWLLSMETNAKNDAIRLESQASYHLFLKMSRCSSRNNCSTVSFTDTQEEICLDFAKRNRGNVFDSDRDDELLQKQRQEASFVLRWRANVTDSCGRQRIVFGQNQLPIVVGPTDGSNLEELQVSYNLVHAACVAHDFQARKLCVVPVKLLLHSVANVPLVIKVHTLGTSSEVTPATNTTLFHPFSSQRFRWVRLGSASMTIAPLSSLGINLSVAVLCPGIYDLGSRLEIWCHATGAPQNAVLQSCRVQSSLIITSSTH